ncbi:MAG: MFS transporter [Pseudomonadales bacterium]|jgi:MFS family permease|nr:MFS transporter [Pseudomonadales bacterium]MDP6471056.1 MFS transporter [Pseudomonadales bacterium]MDP6825758.1 MFS transporter [Pseudomonadales bacterium]MDP6970729.1 MFS transporter [Pseudomonadales bacterium]|tara:strand:+ start:253 stop:1416 length:1164 start_codon:yes stop_codon:yes gene_type:complete
MPVASRHYLLPVLLGSASFVFLNFGLPIQAKRLGADATLIGGMYTVFTLTMVVVRPLVGWALDRYGRRWFFASAFGFYTVAMWAFSRATGVDDFYLARFLQGIGASLMWVSVRTIVADEFDTAERGREMGRLQANSVRGSMLGAFYGFTLIGMMPQEEAWRLAFYGYSVVALAGFVLACLRQRESSQPAATGRRVELVWNADIVRLLVIVFVSGFASALIEPIYLIYLQDKFSLSFMQLAMAFLPAGIVYATLPVVTGRWADRFGRMPLMVSGIALAALASISLPWLGHILMVAGLYTLSAVAWTMAIPAEDALLGDLSEAATRGRLFGMREMAAMTGAAIGPLLGGAIYDYWRAEFAFVINGALLLIASGLAWHWFRGMAPASIER